MCITCKEKLLPLSYNVKDWNTAKEEWNQEAIYYRGTQKCICGQSIEKQFEIKNKENNNTQIVGSVCINTVFEGCNVLLDSVNKITCNVCNIDIMRTSQKSHERSEKHLKIKAFYDKYRKCETCDVYNIERSEPAYKKDCYDCFCQQRGLKQCRRCKRVKKIGESFSWCYDCSKAYKLEKASPEISKLFNDHSASSS